jgi:signal recognition particle subunit SRP54
MFQEIKNKLTSSIEVFSKQKSITPQELESFIEKIRSNFVENDVCVHFTEEIVQKILIRAEQLKDRVAKTAQVGELIEVLKRAVKSSLGSPYNYSIAYTAKKPYVILLCGAQGAGKTSLCGKLAKFIMSQFNENSILITSIDNDRAAAQLQLKMICKKINVQFLPTKIEHSVVQSAMFALNFALKAEKQVLIIDTSGNTWQPDNMHILAEICKEIMPDDVMLVIDGMIGQSGINAMQNNIKKIPITSIAITKMDSNAGSGACLNAMLYLKKPIRYIVNGEDIENIKTFNPAFHYGNLIKHAELKACFSLGNIGKKKQNVTVARGKIVNVCDFNFYSILERLNSASNIANVINVASNMPGYEFIENKIHDMVHFITQCKAIILSMTEDERLNPNIINESRIMRIAKGAGVPTVDVMFLISKYGQLKKNN